MSPNFIDSCWCQLLIVKFMSLEKTISGTWIATYMQVHHGGAGTTATGLKAAVIFFLSSVSLVSLIVWDWNDMTVPIYLLDISD